jgi:hypothetical protein
MIKKLVIGLVLLIVLVVVGFTVLKNVGEDVETVAQVEIVEKSEVLYEVVAEKPDIIVVETSEEIKKSGDFIEIDVVHKGSGKASYLDSSAGPVLKFENFKVTPGPDLFVYLSKNKNIKESKDLGEFVSLGDLKSSKGDQMYNLPEDYEDYNSVVIWCRAFGVLFSVAELS